MKRKRIAALCLLLLQDEKVDVPVKKPRKKRSVWVEKWILRRCQFGAYHQLLKELKIENPVQFSNFVRMPAESFELLIQKIGPLVSKQDTKFRMAIPVQEKLAVTLRYLATGDSYQSLSYTFRIPKCTICLFVPEVCAALSDVLKTDYLKVIILMYTYYMKSYNFLLKL